MANTRLRGPFLVGGPIVAVGTSLFPQGRAGTGINAAATNLGKTGSLIAISGISTAGTIRSGSSIVSGGGLTVAGTIRAGTGFGFVAGNYKRIAAGTYYGIGGATAPITSTGLTTITHIFMQANRHNYSTATTGVTIPRPCVAAGTVGSFYPVIFKIGATGVGALNTVAGTFRWVAYGV